MILDPVILSRLQFTFVVTFHILLPALTIGLAAYIAVLEGLYLFTRREVYLRLSLFWIRVFAVSFGMGVVSGIVMPFQFGLNWARFSDSAADIIGPLLAYEGLTAFFLEASFLGVLLFGRRLVPPWVHFSSALIVACGTLFSAFWILAVNSWMQTPDGYEIIDGRFYPADWVTAIFNPSLPYRLTHVVAAFFLTTAFVIIAVAAYYLRTGKAPKEGRIMLSMTLWLATFLVPLQFVLGDFHGRNTFQYQPLKLAAIEGIWETQSRAPALLFAIPDQAAQENRFALGIPTLASLYLTHDPEGIVRGLKEWPEHQQPPVAIVFFAFRLMVGAGLIMLAVVISSCWLRWRGRLFDTVWFLRFCQLCAPLGFIAVLAGWVTTEVGRQPWAIYGLMRTADAVSPSLSGEAVLASLIIYIAVYTLVFGAGTYYLYRLMTAGPALVDIPKDLPEASRKRSALRLTRRSGAKEGSSS
jgi:cytochrome d ubiquinol oxidase subunit I